MLAKYSLNKSVSRKLALLALIGGWTDECNQDQIAIGHLVGEDYKNFIKELVAIIDQPDSPITYNVGIWEVHRKQDLLTLVGKEVSYNDLEIFAKVSMRVLANEKKSNTISNNLIPTSCEISADDEYSDILCNGMIEGMELLNENSDLFTRCNPSEISRIIGSIFLGKYEGISMTNLKECPMRVSEIDENLPKFAELQPEIFFSELDKSLREKKEQFAEILAKKSTDKNARYKCIWLVNALEALAWDKDNFEPACLMLAKLATLAPKQHETSSPLISLAEILMAAKPQTHASLEQRKFVIDRILQDQRTVGWKLLLTLLSSQWPLTGTYKPMWMEKKLEYSKVVVKDADYRDQELFVAELAIKESRKKASQIAQLIEILKYLPQPARNKFFNKLSALAVGSFNEKEKMLIWSSLSETSLRYRQNLHNIQTISYEDVTKLESVAENFAPKDPMLRYAYLFSGDDDDLFSEPVFQMGLHKELENRREIGAKEILRAYGGDVIVELLESTSTPVSLAKAVAKSDNFQLDSTIIPNFVDSNDWKTNRFIHAYIRNRYKIMGCQWLEKFPMTSWSLAQQLQFLYCLPFEKPIWDRVDLLSKKDAAKYWRGLPDVIHLDHLEEIEFGINILLKYRRYSAAINCLAKLKATGNEVSSSLAIQALLKGTKSRKTAERLDYYSVRLLVRHLQTDPRVDINDLSNVEWHCIRFLDGVEGMRPTTLEAKLAKEPEFFSNVIQSLYPSSIKPNPRVKFTDYSHFLAKSKIDLLDHWQIAPGTNSRGYFDLKQFIGWLIRVKDICTESGHHEIAFDTVTKLFDRLTKDEDQRVKISSIKPITITITPSEMDDSLLVKCTENLNTENLTDESILSIIKKTTTDVLASLSSERKKSLSKKYKVVANAPPMQVGKLVSVALENIKQAQA